MLNFFNKKTKNFEIITLTPHYGGAWKVAYADFVTAMMAFFLLMWLLSISTKDELTAIASYFDPTRPKVSDASSGAGGVMGGLSMSPQGSMATNLQTISSARPSGTTMSDQAVRRSPEGEGESSAVEQAKELLRQEEERRFEEAKEKIEQAIQEDPELAELAKNLIVDITPEGLRIQIVDQDGDPMFASGSAVMFEKTRKLMGKVTEIITDMPNQLSVRGHTDGVPYGAGADYTNWELSADRANASRRVLKESGFPTERLQNVVGKADTDHLFPDNPTDPRNRRISLILLKEELTNPEKFEEEADEMAEQIEETMQDEPSYETDEEGVPIPQARQPIGTFQRTPGLVEFP